MSLKNLSAKIKIPKILKNKLNNKRINKIYNNFEKSLKLMKILLSLYQVVQIV